MSNNTMQSSTMIPLPLLWKWLYVNFAPLPQAASDASDTKDDATLSTGIPKDDVVNELLSLPEFINRPNDQKLMYFARSFIWRFLNMLYHDPAAAGSPTKPPQAATSPPMSPVDAKQAGPSAASRFTSRDNKRYLLRRTTADEREQREKQMPPFPQQLREQLLKEVRDEILGRNSAKNLLKLSSSTSLGPAAAASSPMSTTAANPASPGRHQSTSTSATRVRDRESFEVGGVSTSDDMAPPRKRQRSMAATEASDVTVTAAADEPSTPPLPPDGTEESDVTVTSETAEAEAAAARQRSQRAARQVSTAATTTTTTPVGQKTKSTTGSPLLVSTPSNSAQSIAALMEERRKQEMHELKAKITTLRRELDSLKAENARKEAAHARELQQLKTEIEFLRGAVFKRTASGGFEPLVTRALSHGAAAPTNGGEAAADEAGSPVARMPRMKTRLPSASAQPNKPPPPGVDVHVIE